MKHLRHSALVIVALALCGAPAANAKEKLKGEVVPAPHRTAGLTGGELIGEGWAQSLSNPAGTFTGGCMPIAHKIVSAEVDAEGNASCTIRKGTTLMLFLGSECSDVEEPPFFGEDEEAQRECAIAADEFFVSALLSLDGGEPIEQINPLFERVSPQRTVELPDDNILGAPPGTATFVAHGWIVLVRKLSVGEHVISGTVTDIDGFTTPFEITVDVVRGG
jgi:hypothetical protein